MSGRTHTRMASRCTLSRCHAERRVALRIVRQWPYQGVLPPAP
jgi:hypothetical protein